MTEPLRIYAVYDNPRDMPGCIVVRAHNVTAGFTAPDPGALAFRFSSDAQHAQALEAARRHCQALGLTRLSRHADDDPVIVETWL